MLDAISTNQRKLHSMMAFREVTNRHMRSEENDNLIIREQIMRLFESIKKYYSLIYLGLNKDRDIFRRLLINHHSECLFNETTAKNGTTGFSRENYINDVVKNMREESVKLSIISTAPSYYQFFIFSQSNEEFCKFVGDNHREEWIDYFVISVLFSPPFIDFLYTIFSSLLGDYLSKTYDNQYTDQLINTTRSCFIKNMYLIPDIVSKVFGKLEMNKVESIFTKFLRLLGNFPLFLLPSYREHMRNKFDTFLTIIGENVALIVHLIKDNLSNSKYCIDKDMSERYNELQLFDSVDFSFILNHQDTDYCFTFYNLREIIGNTNHTHIPIPKAYAYSLRHLMKLCSPLPIQDSSNLIDIDFLKCHLVYSGNPDQIPYKLEIFNSFCNSNEFKEDIQQQDKFINVINDLPFDTEKDAQMISIFWKTDFMIQKLKRIINRNLLLAQTRIQNLLIIQKIEKNTNSLAYLCSKALNNDSLNFACYRLEESYLLAFDQLVSDFILRNGTSIINELIKKPKSLCLYNNIELFSNWSQEFTQILTSERTPIQLIYDIYGQRLKAKEIFQTLGFIEYDSDRDREFYQIIFAYYNIPNITSCLAYLYKNFTDDPTISNISIKETKSFLSELIAPHYGQIDPTFHYEILFESIIRRIKVALIFEDPVLIKKVFKNLQSDNNSALIQYFDGVSGFFVNIELKGSVEIESGYPIIIAANRETPTPTKPIHQKTLSVAKKHGSHEIVFSIDQSINQAELNSYCIHFDALDDRKSIEELIVRILFQKRSEDHMRVLRTKGVADTETVFKWFLRRG